MFIVSYVFPDSTSKLCRVEKRRQSVPTFKSKTRENPTYVVKSMVYAMGKKRKGLLLPCVFAVLGFGACSRLVLQTHTPEQKAPFFPLVYNILFLF